mmetsp:Transcript_5942/g.19663  ORF Transcript_5942/g.19663 Transcript_5942/m.19663 type:complete len:226 (-) Transcript_5942:201-878(-)
MRMRTCVMRFYLRIPASAARPLDARILRVRGRLRCYAKGQCTTPPHATLAPPNATPKSALLLSCLSVDAPVRPTPVPLAAGRCVLIVGLEALEAGEISAPEFDRVDRLGGDSLRLLAEQPVRCDDGHLHVTRWSVGARHLRHDPLVCALPHASAILITALRDDHPWAMPALTVSLTRPPVKDNHNIGTADAGQALGKLLAAFRHFALHHQIIAINVDGARATLHA